MLKKDLHETLQVEWLQLHEEIQTTIATQVEVFLSAVILMHFGNNHLLSRT